MKSLRRQLLVWLIAGLALAMFTAAFAVYTRARIEASDLLDYQLQLMAATYPHDGFGRPAVPRGYDEAASGDVIVVQIWDRNGAQLYWSRPGSPILQRLDLGFTTVTTPRGEWRVFNTLVGNNIVQVSQPLAARNELAAQLALRTMLPLLVLLPLLLALVWVTVTRGLLPLNAFAAALRSRTEDALEPLPAAKLPDEIIPLVESLNDLLDRLRRALELQKSFIADAAHELRTPLTAVRLQIQNAERAPTEAERAAAFVQLKAGAERAGRLVQQLLTLARNERGAAERPMTTVDLAQLARDAVAEYAPIAAAKDVDLGLSSHASPTVEGDADALRSLLTNLIDNAVHYTPAGGSVDVSVSIADRQPCWTVTDTGPGIPPAERTRVFDRFYRRDSTVAEGSGLGLAIVQRIAQRHHATVELTDGANGRGLAAVVRFPAQAA